MSTSTAHARKTLNKSEFDLYQSTFGRNIANATPSRLKQKKSRLKKLIEKYSTLKMASKRALKSKGMDSGTESIRKAKLTLLKAALKNADSALKKALRPAAATKARKKSPRKKSPKRT